MCPPSLLPCAAPHRETFKCNSVGWNLLCVWHPINKTARGGCVNCCHVFSPGIPINHPTNCNKLFADIKLWFWTGEYSSTLQQPPPHPPTHKTQSPLPRPNIYLQSYSPLFMYFSCPQHLSAWWWVNEMPSCLFITFLDKSQVLAHHRSRFPCSHRCLPYLPSLPLYRLLF